MKKRLIVIVSVVVIVAAVGITAYVVNQNHAAEVATDPTAWDYASALVPRDNQTVAEKDAELVRNANEVLIGKIDGEDYYAFDPQITQERYALLGGQAEPPEEQAERILKNEAAYRELTAMGKAVGDEELDEYISEQRRLMPEDEEGYDLFLKFCSAHEMTEEEYWQSVRELYRKNLTLANYETELRESLEQELIDEHRQDGKLYEAVDREVEKQFEKMYKKHKIKVLYGE